MDVTRQEDLRERNSAALLARVAAAPEPPSRASLAAATGLTRTTVSALVDQMLLARLLEETDPPGPARGRPAQRLRLSGRRVAGLGVEVGVRHLAAGVRDLSGATRVLRVVPGDQRGAPPEQVLRGAAELAEEVLAAAADQGLEVVGAAWGLPGLVDARAGVVRLAPNLGWHDVDVLGRLRGGATSATAGALPTALENEAALAALAEAWSVGEGAPAPRSFLLVSGEVGIGAGAVVGGRLLRGEHGWSGELGHVGVDPGGPVCGCGATGCLEVYAGQDAVLAAAGLDPDGSTAAEGGGAGAVLARAAGRGEERVLRALADAGRALGVAASSAVNVLDVDAVVLGGVYAPLVPWIGPPLRAELARRVLRARVLPVEVRAARLGADAVVLGGAARVLQGVLERPGELLATALPAAARLP
ncbi:ROK family protein [uncultured Pseudokineococcus sp.]|uniref:ROK family protein n=1 Tax=uncultured Pseudokineococcus sp. TaxID=1642928 RepID=UPI00260AA705|nr:ROK family protein [uncultured Pseudokineococcus sp.]